MRYLYILLLILLFSCNENKKEFYYPTGQIQSVYNYNGIIKDGPFRTFYLNGNLKVKGVYKNDSLDGKIIWFYNEGIIKNETYFKNGIKNGQSVDYYPNGKIEAIAYYRNDLLNGEMKIFYENGKVKKIWNIIDDKFLGEFKSFYENGKIKQYAYLNEDTIFSYRADFDVNGNLLNEDRLISISLNQDTIKLGQELLATVTINGPLRKGQYLKYDIVLVSGYRYSFEEGNYVKKDSILLKPNVDTQIKLLLPQKGFYLLTVIVNGYLEKNKVFGMSAGIEVM